MSTDARCAGLNDVAAVSTPVRRVKARLLMSANPQGVREIFKYAGVLDSEFAAELLAAMDGDVEKCKAEIDRFWKNRHYKGPLIIDDRDRRQLEDTL